VIEITFDGIIKSNRLEFCKETVCLDVKGHAEFSKSGSDIICAAVSVLTQTGVSALNKIAGLKLSLKQNKGELNLEFNCDKLEKKEQEIALIILETIIIGLEEIKNNYPRNVEIAYL
jgi:uncharacterized protein YsxB (DUF464 family)